MNQTDKLEWAESCLKYELYKGITTIHECPCKRTSCRSEKCIYCWREEIKKLKENK